jgi:hypothetical protein
LERHRRPDQRTPTIWPGEVAVVIRDVNGVQLVEAMMWGFRPRPLSPLTIIPHLKIARGAVAI